MWCMGLVVLGMWNFQVPRTNMCPLHCKVDSYPLNCQGGPVMRSFKIYCVSVQLLSCVQLFATPCTAARQASLSITNSQSLIKLMSIESVMLSNHLILCHPSLFLPSVFPSIRVFSNESVLRIRWPTYWSFSFRISPSDGYIFPFPLCL